MSHNDQTPLNHYNYASQLAVVQSADLNNVTQFPKPKSTNKVSSFSPTFTAPKRNVQFDFTKRGGGANKDTTTHRNATRAMQPPPKGRSQTRQTEKSKTDHMVSQKTGEREKKKKGENKKKTRIAQPG